jgi:peroxiredoxin family protein
MKNITKKERSETMIDKKMSKADFIRNWIKGNKDFSPKWMKRLFHDLSQEGYKVSACKIIR